MRKKKPIRSNLPFVQIYDWVRLSPAWRDLSPQARAVYVEMKARFNGSNNGKIGYGAREAAADIGMSHSSANRFLLELEDHGFITRQQESSFVHKRLSIEWCMTEARNDVTGALATKDFFRWSARGKIQKPVSPVEATVSPVGHKKAYSSTNESYSSICETVAAKSPPLQSRRRDTSTSKPLGMVGNVSNEAPQAGSRPVLFGKILRALSSIEEVRPESATSVAISLYADINADLSRDPMVQAVLDTFPGSEVTMDQHELDSIVRHRAERLQDS